MSRDDMPKPKQYFYSVDVPLDDSIMSAHAIGYGLCAVVSSTFGGVVVYVLTHWSVI